MDEDYVVTPGGVVDTAGNPVTYDSSGNVIGQTSSTDYVVTPGGVVDTAGNPVQYDSSGNIISTSTGSSGTSSTTSGSSTSTGTVLDFLKPYTSLFSKISSGQAGANEYAAALGILGLLMPSLNKPRTSGWKGSIDLGRQLNRMPIAQPAYMPYAQSQAPVMGRQFFTSSYGPGAAPVAAPVAPPVTPTTNPMPEISLAMPMPAEPQADTTTQAAEGGLMGLARGGRAMPPRYLRGQTDGMADKIPSSIDGVQPAKLSHGEFVIPADVVSHLGNGNSDAGAKALYKMMDRVRQARTGNKKQGKQINPEKFTPGGVAGYAGGGAVAFQTGGVTGSVNPSQAISNEQNISEWAGPYVGDMLSKTAALTNTPYQAYQGPLVAGTSPLQSQAFQGLSSLGTPSQFNAATQLATQAGQQAGGINYQAGQFNTGLGPLGSVQSYMNPYMMGVTDITAREARRQADISRQAEQARLSQAGAYGGSRQAIMEAERQRNLGTQIEDITTKGLQSAYDRAMAQRAQEAQLGLSAQQAGEQSRQFGAGLGMQAIGQQLSAAGQLGGLGSQQFGTQLQGLGALLNAGQQQRGIEQEGISALQKQYETELIDPYTKLRFQKEMLSGLPVATASTTANQSTMGQLGSGFENIGKLMKELGLS